MKMTKTNEKLKQYLIGNVSEDVAKEVSLKIISNDQLEESLIFAEEDLIEDYLEGELTVDEEALFNQNFLISEERFEQVKTIAQLKRYGRKLDKKEPVQVKDDYEKENFFQSLINSIFKQPFRAFAAFLIIGFVTTFAWIVISDNSNGLSSLETEYAKLNAAEFQDKSEFQSFEPIVLIHGRTRANGKSKGFGLDNLTERVLFYVALRSSSEVSETYKVELIKNGKVLFSQNEIRPTENKSGEELRFFLPKQKLEEGNYQIRVMSNLDNKNQISYPFALK